MSTTGHSEEQKRRKMKKIIKVTNKNIQDGEKANPENCAIAKALKNQFRNKIKGLSVLPSHVAISFKNNNEVFAKMPKEGAEFIKRFDAGLPVNRIKLNLNFKKQYVLV